MKIRKVFSIFLCAVLVAVCFPLDSCAEYLSEEYVEGEIIISSTKEIENSNDVIRTASVDDSTVQIDFEDSGIENIEEVENYTDEENVYVAEVDGDVKKICRELNKNKDIIAEPNYILHTCGFTMPYEVSYNLSVYSGYQKWYLNDIMHIPEAWQENEVTGDGVTIAVIDNGFYINALDFPTKLWKNSQGTVGWNTYKNNDDIGPIFRKTLNPDETDQTNYNTYRFANSAHGSNVAGIIGMPSNSMGGIGAAYGAELMLIQAANYNSETIAPTFTTNALVAAIDFARENGADIINLSLGTTSDSTSIHSAVARAYNAGILVVAAAGNGDANGNGISTSTNRYYPASYSEALGVMAIDKTYTNKLSVFSNYDTSGGKYYDIAAPGVSIVGCNCADTGYTLNSGTSQAAPLVAAVAALYMEKNPDATIQQLKSDMLASATEYVTAYTTTTYRYKSLNAAKFLSYCIPPEIIINMNTLATLDGNYLYGLDEGFTDIGNYISVTDGTGSMTFTPTVNGVGTGSTIKIYNKNNKLDRTITVILFGDVNGDTIVDGQDAVLVNCINGGFTRYFSTAQRYAADVNFDNVVSTDDFSAIFDYGLGNGFISQLR